MTTSYISGQTLFDMVDDFLAATDLYAMLVAPTFSFNENLHEYRSSIANEVSGSGYVTGGVIIPSYEVVLNTANTSVDIVAEDPFFGLINVGEVGMVVIYTASGLATTDRIIAAFEYDDPIDLIDDYFYHVWTQRYSEDDTKGVLARYNY